MSDFRSEQANELLEPLVNYQNISSDIDLERRRSDLHHNRKLLWSALVSLVTKLWIATFLAVFFIFALKSLPFNVVIHHSGVAMDGQDLVVSVQNNMISDFDENKTWRVTPALFGRIIDDYIEGNLYVTSLGNFCR
jgi:hypothetical protein